MTTFNQAQTIELMDLIGKAISMTFGWLAEDKKEDLATVTYIALCGYKPSVAYPEAIPRFPYIQTTVARQAYKTANYIVSVGQRKAEKKETEMASILAELNLDGEESRYSDNFREVSYEEYVERTGFEVACPCIEQEILDRSEETVWEMQVEAFKNAPMFNAILLAGIAHVENGGTYSTFAESLGYSRQTLTNHMKKRVAQANDPNNTYLPFTEYMFNDKPKAKKAPRSTVKKADTSVQLTLF